MGDESPLDLPSHPTTPYPHGGLCALPAPLRFVICSAPPPAHPTAAQSGRRVDARGFAIGPASNEQIDGLASNSSWLFDLTTLNDNSSLIASAGRLPAVIVGRLGGGWGLLRHGRW
jgi:hypothetical protein